MSWLLAAHSVGISNIDQMFVEVWLWHFRRRRHEVRGLDTGPQVAAVIAEVGREYQREEALLAAGAPLPDPESLDSDYLMMVMRFEL